MALSQETTIRLIGGGGARGLSGDARRVLPPDPALDFFDAGLRRHSAQLDVVSDPDQLWECERTDGRPMGLLAHLGAVSRERLSGLTDVLLVVSDADWERATENHGARWVRHVADGLRASFEDWCRAAQVVRRRPGRSLGVQVVAEGSAALHGERLGLGPGEFVTGLLPHFYSGPVGGSRPLISVMVALPGAWSGYREVARLYDDQDLLTLGSHWLDNFSHPAFGAPALYRLQLDESDGLVHLTSPDVPGGFRLTQHGSEGEAAVYGLQRGDGHVVAWIVLAVVEAPEPEPATPVVVESFATVDDVLDGDPAVDDGATVADGEPVARSTAHAAAPLDQLVSLREAGVLLQRVHFRDIMLGYVVYISETGEVGSELADPAATVQVVGRRARLFAHGRGVRVSGVPVPPGAAAALGSSTEVQVGAQRLEYRDLSSVRLKGWPYVGEIRRVGANVHLTPGAVHTVGRDPDARVRLPDDSHNGNILWRPEVDSGATIQSRNGEIPKAHFTLDSIMVATNHAAIDLTGAQPVVENTARHCFSFIRRQTSAGTELITLSRVERPVGGVSAELKPGDELLIGNCVLKVDLDRSGPDESLVSTPPPVAFSLAEDAVPESALDELPPPPPMLSVPPPEAPPVSSTATWIDDNPGADPFADPFDDPTAVPGGGPPPLDLGVDLGSEDDSALVEPTAPAMSSVDDAWSPFDSVVEDDPTELPVPRFARRPKK